MVKTKRPPGRRSRASALEERRDLGQVHQRHVRHGGIETALPERRQLVTVGGIQRPEFDPVRLFPGALLCPLQKDGRHVGREDLRPEFGQAAGE